MRNHFADQPTSWPRAMALDPGDLQGLHRVGTIDTLTARDFDDTCIAPSRTPAFTRYIGIDHGFSFPLRYFEVHQLEPAWPTFLEDFQRHWPTDAEHTYVNFVRDGLAGNGAARAGNTRWRRMTEQRAGSAKSVFHFDVQGSVAKSTHAGIPWLLYLRRQLGSRLHFWPFDGWSVPAGKSAVVEVYPSLWKYAFPANDRTPDQHDAFAVASWISEADRSGQLERFLQPHLTLPERMVAGVEGWILGVG